MFQDPRPKHYFHYFHPKQRLRPDGVNLLFQPKVVLQVLFILCETSVILIRTRVCCLYIAQTSTTKYCINYMRWEGDIMGLFAAKQEVEGLCKQHENTE